MQLGWFGLKLVNLDEMFVMQVMCIGYHFNAIRLIEMEVG